MRLRTILLLILLLILAVPVIGAIGLWWVDESVYRRLIAERVEQATGRKLTIDGPLHLALALRPTLAAQRVTLANAPWASEPDMVALERLEARFDALSLLSGRPEIDRLTLVRPIVRLEVGPDGTPNWQLAPAGPAPASEGQSGGGGGGAAFPTVRELAIVGGLVTWRDARGGPGHELGLDRARILNLEPSSPMSLELDGAIDDLKLAFQGQAGPIQAFLAGEPVPIDLAGEVAGIESEVNGTVASPTSPTASLAFRFRAESLAGLAGRLPAPVPLEAMAPLDLAGRLAGDPRRLALTGLSLLVGESRLEGGGAVRLDGPRPRVEADLSAERLSLDPFLGRGGAAAAPPADGGVAPAGPLFPREPLPLAGLRLVDVTASLHVGELLLKGLSLREVELAAQLEQGRLRLEPARLTLDGRPVTGSLAVDTSAERARFRLEARGSRLDLGRLLEHVAVTSLLEGEGSLRATLAAQGVSPHDLARSLAGEASLVMAGGGLRPAALDRLTGGAGALLAAALGRPPGELVQLRCLTLAMPVANGIARPDLALDSELATLVGRGTVDLGREQVDLALSPRAKVASVAVSLPVTARGPLARPAFGIDREGAALRLGSLLGAIALPPGLREAMGELGDGEDGRGCLAAAATAAEPRAPGASPAPREPKGAVEAAKGALGRAGQGLLQDLLRGR